MKISLCIMGCGDYASKVLDEISDMTDLFDFHFASRDSSKAEAYCNQYGGAGYYGSYEDAAADPSIDAMYFFTPHHLHLENASLAADNSKHILMEKPVARNMEEARQLIQVAKNADVRLMVAENYRFLPSIERCKAMIDSGEIGKLRQIQMNAESFGASTEWRTDAAMTGGGVFIDGGIHYVDAMMTLGGYPQSVYAIKPPQVHHETQGEDGIAMMARLPDGVVGLLNFSRATPLPESRHEIQVTGSKGTLRFNPMGDEIVFHSSVASRIVSLPRARRGVRPMLQEFHSSISESREPSLSGEEALKALAIVLAAYRSADEGGEVLLSPV
ncbi:MAG: Gfo/Idh/MocA family oxidoreductase [Chloroflexi bacterium]|nr:Gfo/Idh/MocA family oxidoreductase [Chloroflexota bacterium]